MFKRIALLVATNLLIMLALGVSLTVAESVFGWRFTGLGQALFIAAFLGFGGALVSLLLSKTIALWTTGARVLTETAEGRERWLVDAVRRLSDRAGLRMPTVALYASDEPNAFATGPSRRHALVAVSTGLMNTMPNSEIEAVLAHELSHIANGDMVTMTLLQGALNTVVLLVARLVGQLVDRAVFQSRDGYGPGYFITSWVSQIVLGLLASLLVCAFSRWREYRADEGSARLLGSKPMIAALRRLAGTPDGAHLPQAVQALAIHGDKPWAAAWRTHPSFPARIQALEASGL